MALRAKDPRLWVAAILLLSVLVRVGFVVHSSTYRPSGDAASYDHDAVSLAVHGEYPPSTIAPSGGPNAYRPPAYPYLLAAVYRFTGTSGTTSRFVAGRVLSAVLSTAVVGLVGVIGWLLWGWGLGMVVAILLAAVYPPLITIGDAMLSEPLFTVFVLGAVAAALLLRRSEHRPLWAALAGSLIGLAALTRTNGIIILLPIAAGIWLRPRLTRASVIPVAALLVSALLVLIPWTVRNTVEFHRFVPLSTEGGITLAGTYNQVSRAATRIPAAWRVPNMAPYNALLRPGENEAVIDQHFLSHALSFLGHHPTYPVRVAYYNMGRLLGLEGASFEHAAAPENAISQRVSDLDVYAFYALAFAVIIAVALGALRRAPTFVWLVPAAIVISLIFVSADMRYRLPIDPFLLLILAGAVDQIVRRRMRSRAAVNGAPGSRS